MRDVLCVRRMVVVGVADRRNETVNSGQPRQEKITRTAWRGMNKLRCAVMHVDFRRRRVGQKSG